MKALPDAGRRPVTVLAGIALAVLAAPAVAGGLIVEVSGLATARGNVIVRVYDSADGFPREPARAVATQIVPAKVGTVTVEFEPPRATRVAVAVAHDEDGNRALDFNLLGMPREPYGFSRAARGRFGPPDFDAAVVDVPAPGTAIPVTLSPP